MRRIEENGTEQNGIRESKEKERSEIGNRKYIMETKERKLIITRIMMIIIIDGQETETEERDKGQGKTREVERETRQKRLNNLPI